MGPGFPGLKPTFCIPKLRAEEMGYSFIEFEIFNIFRRMSRNIIHIDGGGGTG